MRFGGILVAGLALAAIASPASAAGDVEAGKNVFKKCSVCHNVEAGKNKIGPTLFGVIGRKSATVAGFAYSQAMKDFDKTWSPELLKEYLVAPMTMVKGTKMSFPGLPSEKERDDVIAYLETLK